MDVQAVDREEFMAGNAHADALADGKRAVAAGVGQHQRELVAAEARDDVGLARAPPDDGGGLDQRAAAKQVAVRVVDRLESVEIDEQERQRTAAARRALGFAAEDL